MQNEPDTINPSVVHHEVFGIPFNQGLGIRERGEPPVNGRCDSRMGEILLQFLLTHQVISMADTACRPDFFRQFLAPFHLVVHDIEIHTLERTRLAGDEVVIGSYYLCFEREASCPGKKVIAQGLFTVRRNDRETLVKFTSSTYQFNVRIRGDDLPAASVFHNGQVTETGPIPVPSVKKSPCP